MLIWLAFGTLCVVMLTFLFARTGNQQHLEAMKRIEYTSKVIAPNQPSND